MLISEVLKTSIYPSLELFPESLTSTASVVMLVCIGLQESEFIYRRQINGPARGFWQFEKMGGVHGVMRHPSSGPLALTVCSALDVRFDEQVIYNRLAVDDVLAAAFARLLLWTDPKPLPDSEEPAYQLYLRTWRPGAAKRDPEGCRSRWSRQYPRAKEAVMG